MTFIFPCIGNNNPIFRGVETNNQLLLWTCCRVGDIRRLVVNWDIAAVREASRRENVYAAPMDELETSYCVSGEGCRQKLA